MTNLELFASIYEQNGNDYDFDYPEGEYEIIDDGDWVDEGKYSCKTSIVKFNGEYIAVSTSRSGSYFTDYYYDDTEIYPCERLEETKVVVSYPTVGKPIRVPAKY